MGSRKILAAFDFDHTVIDGNSDVVVMELGDLPPGLNKPAPGVGWTEYMDSIFVHLWKNHGVSYMDLIKRVLQVPFSAGMQDLFEYLRCHQDSVETIIVSDSNTEFINAVLLDQHFSDVVRKVYTNPARVEDSGVLRVSPYLKTKHSCPRCNANMCKGDIIEKHRKESGASAVIYVGDGKNDFCPALRLKKGDVVFARRGYALEKLIESGKEGGEVVHADVVIYEDAVDVKKGIEELLLSA